MRTLLLVLPAVLALGDVADAQRRRFPYRATIASGEVYARSGPGQRYYATSKLAAGDRVVIHRHDPGGWYMITPPPGSFSWIRADYVTCDDGRSGIVSENNVVVRVGSSYGEVQEVEQRRLSKGDRVTILGEQTLRDDRGAVRMYKIAPPQGEYRWISGRSCVPEDERERIVRQNDPYSTPAMLGPPETVPHPHPDPGSIPGPPPTDGFVEVEDGDAVHQHRPDPTAARREQNELRDTDLAFKRMVERDPTTWKLQRIWDRYKVLERDARHPSVRSAIPSRLAAVKRYNGIRGEYVDFVQLTNGTAARDAQLVTLQRQRVHSLPPAPPIAPNPGSPPPAPPASPAEPPSTVTENVTICGAGIVQRSITGGASHALVAPTGRVLAYLRPANPSVDLDAFLGRQVGAVGDRSHDATLQGDVIRVDELVPVRLTP